MYSELFCKVYNEFGWNYFPEAFAEELLAWLQANRISIQTSLDLACGSGVLCEILNAHGIRAAGMDLSEGMISVARGRNAQIHYEVADMITYRPDEPVDLVTCTGDALNHILNTEDVERIFQNVFGYLNEGGYFIFDILHEQEIPASEPFELVFDDKVTAQFSVTRDEDGIITLKTVVFENGFRRFEENITEIVHDPAVICSLLQKCGFQVCKCAHQLLDDETKHGSTWYIIARKSISSPLLKSDAE